MRRVPAMSRGSRLLTLLWVGGSLAVAVGLLSQGPALATDLFDKLKGKDGSSSSSGSTSSDGSARSDSGSSSSDGGTVIFQKIKGGSSGSSGGSTSSLRAPSSSDGHTTLFERLSRPRPPRPRPYGYVPPPLYYYDYYYYRPSVGLFYDPWSPTYPRYLYARPGYSVVVDMVSPMVTAARPPSSDAVYDTPAFWGGEIPYYGPALLPDSPERALQDLVQGWLEENVDLIMRHVHPERPVQVYIRGRLSHTLTYDQFHEATLEAFERIETSKFTVLETHKGANFLDAKVRHVFFDKEERSQSVEVQYRLEQDPVTKQWSITRVGFGSRPSGSSSCFIATAAYGSPQAEEVVSLRLLRDRVLLRSSWGRRMVALYYRWSPPLADWVRSRPWAKAGVRWMLRPWIWLAHRWAE